MMELPESLGEELSNENLTDREQEVNEWKDTENKDAEPNVSFNKEICLRPLSCWKKLLLFSQKKTLKQKEIKCYEDNNDWN